MQNKHLISYKNLISNLNSKRALDLASIPNSHFEQAFMDINSCIDLYNQVEENLKRSELKINDLINSAHLKRLVKVLPPYEEVIEKLLTDSKLQKMVLQELLISPYFVEVYKIESDIEYLVNILILFYRGSLLHLHPNLRSEGAQISSTIEEMSLLLAEQGYKTTVFNSTYMRFESYEDEGFSKAVYELFLKLSR